VDIYDIQVAKNADGTLQVFGIGTDDKALYHKSQTANGWSDWANLGGWHYDIEVGQNQDGRLEVFAIGSDRQLYHKTQTAPNSNEWSGWSGMGGWHTEIELVEWPDGRIELFAIGGGNGVYKIWQHSPNGAWSGWAAIGPWLKEIEAVINGDGKAEVFGIGGNNALYHQWCCWSGWHGLGGWIDDMEVVKFKDGHAYVFAIGSDDALYQRWYDNGWKGWISLGGELSSIEQVVVNQDGGLDIFAINHDNNFVHKSFSFGTGWSDWSNFGGTVSEIKAAKNADGTLTVLATDTNNAMYVTTSDAMSWGTGFESTTTSFTDDDASHFNVGENTIEFTLKNTGASLNPAGLNYKATGTVSHSSDLGDITTRSSFAIGAIGQVPMRSGESQDQTPPEIGPVSDIELEAAKSFGAQVHYDVPSVSDDEDADPTIECTPEPGSLFPIGISQVTCAAMDSAQNIETKSFKITVVDTIPPTISAPEDITVEASSPQGTVVDLGDATVSDAGDPNPSVTNSAPTYFNLGETQVTWNVMDANGNSATDTQTVTVVDTTPPRLEIPEDIVAECTLEGSASVQLGITNATDANDGFPVISNDSPGLFPLGETTVTWTATDSSENSETGIQLVTVQDTTGPSFAVPPRIVVDANTSGGYSGEIGDPAWYDSCVEEVVVTNDAPDLFPLGDTEVAWTATDSFGNESTGTQIVTIQPLRVTIDIKPGSEENIINDKGHGVVPVAILTTDEFDATTIDFSSITFGEGEIAIAPSHKKGHIEDVDGDKRDELMLHFESGETIDDTIFNKFMCIDGTTLDGTPIQGCDIFFSKGDFKALRGPGSDDVPPEGEPIPETIAPEELGELALPDYSDDIATLDEEIAKGLRENPAKPDDKGRPEDKGKPDDKGKPEDKGKQVVRGLPLEMRDKDLPFPLKQFKLGIAPSDVQCRSGYELLLRATTATPACVTPSNAELLISLGWGIRAN